MRSQCSHCINVSTARELGVPGLQELIDEYYKRPDNLAIRYGIRFEEQLEMELLANLGHLVQKPKDSTLEATLELMNEGVPVIYQGTLRGGSGAMLFSGRPDFLLRSDYEFSFGPGGLTANAVDGWTGGYTAWDAKLSQTAKPDYQIQVGLYVDVLENLGLSSNRQHGLLLGNRTIAGFQSDVVVSQLLKKRNEYLRQVFEFIEQAPMRLEDVGALICDASSYCDLCEYPDLCQAMRVETNHLQLVANITRPQIESLYRAGVRTVAELASFTGFTDKLSAEQLEPIRKQAQLQQRYYETGVPEVEVVNPEGLRILGEEDPGDIFFDLEGFTFFDDPGGLEYLFGWVSIDQNEGFSWLWADDRESERAIFEQFMESLKDRLDRFPKARVFHYANYEQAALKRLAQRFQSHHDYLAELLERGVFVDLYKVVKASIQVSEPKYSIKNLETFYTFARSSDVKEAMGSMEYYDQYVIAREEDPNLAETLKRQVLSYNQDDCVSTLALTRWLRSLRT